MPTQEEYLAPVQIGTRPNGHMSGIKDYPEKLKELRDTEEKIAANNRVLATQAALLESMSVKQKEAEAKAGAILTKAMEAAKAVRAGVEFSEPLLSDEQVLVEISALFGLTEEEFHKQDHGRRDPLLTAARSYACHRLRDSSGGARSFKDIDDFLRRPVGSAYFYYHRYGPKHYQKFIIRAASDKDDILAEVNSRVSALIGASET